MRSTGRGPVALAQVTVVAVFLLAFVSGAAGGAALATNATITTFLNRVDSVLTSASRANNVAWWAWNTNITDANERVAIDSDLAYEATVETLLRNGTTRGVFAAMPTLGANSTQFRLLKALSRQNLGVPLNVTKSQQLNGVVARMSGIYSAGQVCGQPLLGAAARLQNVSGCINLDPELTNIMATNRSFDTLLAAWRSWHDAVGPPTRPLYERYVNLSNEGARDSNASDAGALWRSGYDPLSADEFSAQVDSLWQMVRPLYRNLHCYVRRKLGEKYGRSRVPSRGPIPAHLLGNMWAQDWSHIYDLVAPFPDAPSGSSDDAVRNRFPATDAGMRAMVNETQRFYTSLGLPALPQTFWNSSMFTRPARRAAVCHASAWDFSKGDVRLKMCAVPTLEDFYVTSHEMGHLYYFLAYKDQPLLFRDGAHDGFHEAIGDTMALSARPPWHLRQVGLAAAASTAASTPEARLNFLMKTALEKVAFLPFGLLVDRWRWDVFAGKASFGPALNASTGQWAAPAARLSPDQWNALWWAYRQRFQGVAAPVNRTAASFDPGAKFHVPNSVPYMRYFLSENLQFQLHKALCGVAGFSGPLSNCSIAGSRDAGAALWGMLSLGSSRPWPEALFNLTGSRNMSSAALREYFSPLSTWLLTQNAREVCGWPGEDGAPATNFTPASFTPPGQRPSSPPRPPPPAQAVPKGPVAPEEMDSGGNGAATAFGVIFLLAAIGLCGFMGWKNREFLQRKVAVLRGENELARFNTTDDETWSIK